MARSERTASSTDPDDVVLRTEELRQSFGELVAVDGVSIAVERGEFRSVIGPNGAGKTTLFNLISGALTPTAGTVHFDGEDITGLPSHERVDRGLARSFQLTTVFNGLSVRENVRVSVQAARLEGMSGRDLLLADTEDLDDITERTHEVLARIDLADRADERASTLPYGDRRRLEIGIVLATDPEVVLLDEPTAGMSGDETREAIELIETVLADKTLVLVEHDVDLVMDVSDSITVLHRGRVLAEGTPDEIAASETVQEAYLGGHE